jgi:hypothetical protein
MVSIFLVKCGIEIMEFSLKTSSGSIRSISDRDNLPFHGWSAALLAASHISDGYAIGYVPSLLWQLYLQG